MATALIVGGDGMLGRALRPALAARGLTVSVTSRRPDPAGGASLLDLASDPAAWRLPQRPDIVFLCAAMTGLAACDEDPIGSRVVNVTHTLALARELAAQGSRLVYPSTNLVLAGKTPFQPANAPLRPCCEYAHQKAETETALLALGPRAAILRMTKVMPPRNSLVGGWITTLREGRPIRPLSDLRMAPIPLAGLIESLVRVGLDGAGGLYQVTGAADLSYAEFAARIAERIGAPVGLVQPASAAELGVALRAAPFHTTLDPSRADHELGIKPFALDETLNRMDFDAD